MDVDLLRPGTVPIAPETILWFEFLLDKNLLLTHLAKPNSDPSPTELITKFTTAIYESKKNDVIKHAEPENVENGASFDLTEPVGKPSLKVLALKILSLKVVSYIKWNLAYIRPLTFKIQTSLLQELLYFTNNLNYVDIHNVPEHTDETSSQHLFALIIYYRWFIGTCMLKILHNPVNNFNRNNGDMTGMEESLICTPENTEKCLKFLNDSLLWEKIPPMLTYDCFVMLTETSTETQFEWNLAVPVSKEEYRAQIHYDLASFYFFRENYELAAMHFVTCMEQYQEIGDQLTGFCSVDLDKLESYLIACNQQGKDCRISLLQQLSNSIVNCYKDTLNILIQDNKLREIPISHRINLELDIQGAVSSGKFTVARDLLAKIQALNAVRCIVSRYNSHQFNAKSQKNLDFLIWATSAMWKSASAIDKTLLASYYTQLIINLESENLLDKLLSHEVLADIFDEIDVEQLKKSVTKTVVLPDALLNPSWEFPDVIRHPKLELRLLVLQVISCYDPMELRELLVKLTIKNPSRPAWKINPIWELDAPLKSVVTSIPRGFLQDFSYVMLAKSKEFFMAKNWSSSIEFLRILEVEVQANSSLSKLSKLISWEILLVQITHLFDEWPAPSIDRQALLQSWENCLKSGEYVIPRTEVMEQCVLCLLNLGRWDYLTSLNKPWSFYELAAAVSNTCLDMIKYKGSKKMSKDLWDLVVPAFAINYSQTKRSSSGSTTMMHRDSQSGNTKIHLFAFLSKLRDATCLAIVISMLSRLYNIVRDDGSTDVSIDYIMLWPSSIGSINSYNTGAVAEALSDLVLQALKYYPTNVPWLRLMGDINYSNSNFEIALKYYLQALIVSSDYFNLPVRADDHIFRRMIKSCTHLGCHTQAAVLCQFLEDPDYTLAFRSLVDFKSCNDSVEAYYHCFWDMNILEYLVHLHHKRGEFQRRKKAIHTIGLLELNSSNNEEIQREAVNLRKRTFLQAMCKQYVR